MLRFLKRTAETAIKLPFAMAWDVISLGNMGDGSSTVDVLNEHKARKSLDDWAEIAELLKEIRK